MTIQSQSHFKKQLNSRLSAAFSAITLAMALGCGSQEAPQPEPGPRSETQQNLKFPKITKHPVSLSVKVGEPASFKVEYEAESAPDIHWMRVDNEGGLENIEGATNAELNFDSVKLTDAGTYCVSVCGGGICLLSEQATLTVGESTPKPEKPLPPTTPGKNPNKPSNTDPMNGFQVLTTNENHPKLLERSHNTPIMLMFSYDQCSACQEMLPIVKDQNEKDNRWVLAYTDTEKTTVKAQYKLKGCPTLVLLWKGKEIDRNLGFCDDKSTRKFIAKAMSKVTK